MCEMIRYYFIDYEVFILLVIKTTKKQMFIFCGSFKGDILCHI